MGPHPRGGLHRPRGPARRKPRHVASLGKSGAHGATTTTTTLPTGSASRLLDQWATCIRAHGDPDQADPTVNADKVIEVTLGAGWTEGLGGALHGACGTYMTAAETALRGGEPPPTPSLATLEKFAQCMRANGVPDYPDPTAGQSVAHGSAGGDLDPANPTLQAASTLCDAKTGFVSKFGNSAPQPGSVNLNPPAGGFGGKPGGNGGSGAVTAGG